MTELTDAELLKLAVIDGYSNIKPGKYEASSGAAIAIYGSELLAAMRAAIAADRANRPQPAAEALQAAYVEWFKANQGIPPSPTAARTAAAFTLAALRGEVEL